MSSASELWVFLAASPLTWLALTLTAYLAGDALAARSGRHPIVNPVFIAISLVGGALILTGTDYRTYFDGAQFVHVLLGPATVALAVPMLRQRAEIRRNWLPIGAALLAGAMTGLAAATMCAAALGGSDILVRSIAPKSVTAAIAMGIARATGGEPALAAVLVIFTGIIGAVMVTPLMNVLGIKDWRARGFAAGLAAHGIGTARAFTVHPVAGTFAGLALALNGLITALIAPLILKLVAG